MKNFNYKIYTLGCKVNQYDSRSLQNKLSEAGFSLVKAGSQIALVNTCAVTQTAIRKDKRMINKARKENPKAKIIALGCWTKLENEKKAPKPKGIDLVWGVGDYDKLIIEILALLNKGTKQSKLISHHQILKKDNRSRYFIKIQDGCEQYCSYCVVPYARGGLRSRGEEEVLEEIKEAIRNDYKEIVLSGIHLGLYGKDLPGRVNLLSLIKKIIVLPGLGRIRLSSIEINEVSDLLIELIAKSKKICNHLHIPLQSGNDKIINLMNRPYTKSFFKDRVKSIRKRIPLVAISTDVIVGFPGENGRDFNETYQFVKDIKFSRVHVFPYSSHKKTASSKYKSKVSESIKKARASKLRNLGDKLQKEYKNLFNNKILSIIVEDVKDKEFTGMSEYYFTINNKKYKKINKGDLVSVNFKN